MLSLPLRNNEKGDGMSRIVFASQLRKNLRPNGASAIPFYARPKAWVALGAINCVLATGLFLPGKMDALWGIFTPAKAYSLPASASLSSPSSSTDMAAQMAEDSAAPPSVSDLALATAAVRKPAPVKARLDAKGQRAAEYLAQHYRIARVAADLIVSEAYKSGKANKIDPLLILAVIGVESRLNPLAESSVGALGLMQALPEAHPEKIERIGDQGYILNIADNIRVGSDALGEYLRRFGGNEVLALQQYNGSLNDQSRRYSAKVLALRSKIQRASA
jgi:soluble lytic murein transglycosylase-like protein